MGGFLTAAIALAYAAFAQADVQFLGRVNPATRELAWSGTGLGFTFVGTSATVQLSRVTGSNSVDLSIDGGAPTVISNVAGNSITTPGGLASGNHTVVLRKRSEASYGSIFIGNVTTSGTLGGYAPRSRRIEIIGDSISVGYGLDGTNPCTNTAAVENAPKTYGALAAGALGAEYSIVAWSGKGIVRNYGAGDNAPLMPQLWTRYSPVSDPDNTYNFPAASTPDVVTINLGTNDFGYLNARQPLNIDTYKNAMLNFVKTIWTKYPNAHVFLLSSPMLSDTYPTAADAQKTTQINALKSVVTQLNSTKAHFVDLPTQGSAVGCDYHPNAATHAAEGTILASAIKSALGW